MITYSIETDFKNASDVNLYDLQKKINENQLINATVSVCDLVGDNINITLTAGLTIDEKNELDSIISNYVYSEPITAEIYDAIVDINGNGDYLLPSQAFADGHVSVFMRNGIYMESQDVVMPDYGSITGESGGNVVIHFLGLGHSIRADGSGGVKETIGTISLTHLSNEIVGTNTKFTNLNPGAFILIGTNYYRIAQITDDTHLNLIDTYRGVSIQGLKYIAQNMLTGVMLTKLIITGSSSYGVYLRACWHFTLISVAIKQNTPNLHIEDCGDSGLKHVLIEYGNGGGGIVINNSISISFDTADVYNNFGHGICLMGFCESILFGSCETSNNGGCGFHLDGTNIDDIGISNSVIKANVDDGLYIGTNIKNAQITNLSCKNNGGNGIHVLGDENIILSNVFTNNALSGILIKSSDNIINGNISKHNKEYGITIDSNYIDNIVVNNNLKSNLNTNLNDLGVGTAKADNMV